MFKNWRFCFTKMLNKILIIVRSTLCGFIFPVFYPKWIYFLFLFNVCNLTLQFTDAKNTTKYDGIVCITEENGTSIEGYYGHDSKCETPSCVKVAAQIISYIDESIDPCENFYQFANGHYINEISTETEDYEERGFDDIVSDSVNRKVGLLLSEPLQRKEWNPIRLAKLFYKSCLNETIIDTDEYVLTNILKWLGGNSDLFELFQNIKEVGFDTNIIFELSVAKSETNKLLQISSGNYELSKYQKIRYWNLMVEKKHWIFTGDDDEMADLRAEKEMINVFEFEEKLVEISSTSNDDYEEKSVTDSDDLNDDDDSYPIYTIKELKELYPYWDWFRYIRAIVPSGLNVTEDERIWNLNPQFFEKLGDVLNSTSKRTLTTYVLWRALFQAQNMQILETGKIRRKNCIISTSEKFSIPVGLLYSRNYLSEESRQAIIHMAEDIRHAFIDILGEVMWMDDQIREKAIEKAKNIIAHIGYPNELYGSDEIEKYYDDLKMKPDNYFDNSLRWEVFHSNQLFKSMRRPDNRSGWEEIIHLNPTEVNAAYHTDMNTMKFPVAVLHELLFSIDRPQYINYASLGYIVGHEITHAFGTSGLKYDLNGKLNYWGNTEIDSTFWKKAECFIDQYNHYTDPSTNLTLNGNSTLDENIADNGGIRAAYYAYRNWIERNGSERLLPGVKFNQKQLFWISYAQYMSSVDGQMYLIDQIKNDEHAPNEYRCNGVVSNMHEFANDFNCPVDTNMNPARKCRVY